MDAVLGAKVDRSGDDEDDIGGTAPSARGLAASASSVMFGSGATEVGGSAPSARGLSWAARRAVGPASLSRTRLSGSDVSSPSTCSAKAVPLSGAPGLAADEPGSTFPVTARNTSKSAPICMADSLLPKL
jgi:hypothetical protein